MLTSGAYTKSRYCLDRGLDAFSWEVPGTSIQHDLFPIGPSHLGSFGNLFGLGEAVNIYSDFRPAQLP